MPLTELNFITHSCFSAFYPTEFKAAHWDLKSSFILSDIDRQYTYNPFPRKLFAVYPHCSCKKVLIVKKCAKMQKAILH